MLLGILVVFAAGCSLFGHSYDPTTTGIYVSDDRTILSAEITDFDNSKYEEPRYSEDELRDFVEKTVDEYNQKQTDGEEKVSIEKLSVDDTTATLILKYAGAADYLEFNGVSEAVPIKNLIVGSVKDGIDSGVDFSGMLDFDGNPADAAAIKENTEYTLVLFKGNTELQCEGKIQFYSEGLKKTDDYTVTSSDEETSFVIFK